MRAMAFSFTGRKLRKRDFRSLFIMRIKAAVETHGTKYSIFIHKLKQAHCNLNRKMLSQIALFDSQAFAGLVNLPV